MSLVEAFVGIAMFVGIYGSLIWAGFVVDKLLRRFFNVGIFPKGYFE